LIATASGLSDASTLAFQQGVTNLLGFFWLSYNVVIDLIEAEDSDNFMIGLFLFPFVCCCPLNLLVQNILSYYMIETENDGVRISCIVFSGMIWIQLLIVLFYGNEYHGYIERSRASRKQQRFYRVFLIFSKVLVLARSIIFEGYYPSLVFIARDKERFFSEFKRNKGRLNAGLFCSRSVLSSAIN
jgi:hypothetical protein